MILLGACVPYVPVYALRPRNPLTEAAALRREWQRPGARERPLVPGGSCADTHARTAERFQSGVLRSGPAPDAPPSEDPVDLVTPVITQRWRSETP